MAEQLVRRTFNAIAFVAVLVAGCGGGPAIVAVSGRVTLDNQPLAKASVQFMPIAPEGSIDAAGPGSMGVTDENGRYTLVTVDTKKSGAIVGQHRVIIQTAFSAARSDAPGTKEKLPARYHANTELRFTVPKEGSTEANFELLSR